MDTVIEGLEAVTVHICDIDRARKFYSEVLGLREISYIPRASRAAFAIPGTNTLLTMHPLGEGGRAPGTESGMVFSDRDPETACAEIRRRGGPIVDEPKTYPTALGTVTLGVFADPDGNQSVIRHIHP